MKASNGWELFYLNLPIVINIKYPYLLFEYI